MGVLDTPGVSPSAAKALARRLQAVSYDRAFPAVMSSPPTTAFVTPGGASPITSPASVPWASKRFTVLGATLTKVSAQDFGENATNGGWTPGLFSVEFDYYGAACALGFKQRALNGAQIWAWVDGQPVTADPETLTAAASSSTAYYGLTFAGAAQRRIRFYIRNADLAKIDIGPTDSIGPTRRPLVKVAWYGDSWVDSATGANFPAEAMVPVVERLLGVEMSSHGNSGTGYMAPGTSTRNYQDSARLAGVAAAAPNLVIISGTSNDDSGYTSTQITNAAAAVYAALATSLPGVPIVVIGPPALSSVVSAGRLANRDAVKAAALAAPNVIGFIDPLDPRGIYASTPAWVTNTAYKVNDLVVQNNIVQEARINNTRAAFTAADWNPTTWITGTGKVGATAGDGNADLFVINDGLHPTPLGYVFLGRMYAEALTRLFASLATSVR